YRVSPNCLRNLIGASERIARGVVLPEMIGTNQAVVPHLPQRKSGSPMNAQVLPGMDPAELRHKTISPQQALRLQLALPNTGRPARRQPFIHQHWVIHHGNVEKYPATCSKSLPTRENSRYWNDM